MLSSNSQVLEKNKHVLANSFVMFINRAPVFRFRSHRGFADSGQNGTEDLFPQDHQRPDGADGLGWNRVSSGILQFGQEILAPQFFQIVSRSASVVVGISWAAHRLDGGRELPGSESIGRARQRQGSIEHLPHSWLFYVNAADSGLAHLGGPGE